MSPLGELGLEPLRDAAVHRTTGFREASARLVATGLSAIAILDDERRVVGLFGEDELLRGVFPRYLGELRHSAFAPDDIAQLAEHLDEIGDDPVERHMREPLAVEADTSATHLAELLLHSEVTAVALVRDGRFAGMLAERDFCRALLRRCGVDTPSPT